MAEDSRSRKWQVTLNNPFEKGYCLFEIKEIVLKFKGLQYFCMSDEIGENGTYHTHIYLHFKSGFRFRTLKNAFPEAHFEMCKGSSKDNRDYIFKIGKWENDKKKETNLALTHFEWGELPVERQGARNDLIDLYDMINSGMSNYEILQEDPRYMMMLDKIEMTRQLLLEERYKREFRDLYVEYIYGDTGTGKTRSIMEEYGYDKVYRVTDYLHPFDSYKGQSVIIFEEFRSSLRIDDMLKYLDGYPVELPCRYVNKVACFLKVYIITNVHISEQYPNVQKDNEETWKAFLRRIHKVKEFKNYKIREFEIKKDLSKLALKQVNEYNNEFLLDLENPFNKEMEQIYL